MERLRLFDSVEFPRNPQIYSDVVLRIRHRIKLEREAWTLIRAAGVGLCPPLIPIVGLKATLEGHAQIECIREGEVLVTEEVDASVRMQTSFLALDARDVVGESINEHVWRIATASANAVRQCLQAGRKPPV